jgi:hypothetical protein
VPVPDGSPHCSTKIEATVSRWHGVLSKKPCLASERKELTVHGALSASRLTFTSPRSVAMVTSVGASFPGLPGGLSTDLAGFWPSLA